MHQQVSQKLSISVQRKAQGGLRTTLVLIVSTSPPVLSLHPGADAMAFCKRHLPGIDGACMGASGQAPASFSILLGGGFCSGESGSFHLWILIGTLCSASRNPSYRSIRVFPWCILQPIFWERDLSFSQFCAFVWCMYAHTCSFSSSVFHVCMVLTRVCMPVRVFVSAHTEARVQHQVSFTITLLLIFKHSLLLNLVLMGSAIQTGLHAPLLYVNTGDQTHFFRAGEKAQ